MKDLEHEIITEEFTFSLDPNAQKMLVIVKEPPQMKLDRMLMKLHRHTIFSCRMHSITWNFGSLKELIEHQLTYHKHDDPGIL